MIHEVDEALRRLVRDEALRGSDLDVVFEAPTKDWASRRNAPTVNLYLYDLREDLRRRSRGMINEYNEEGHVVARHQPPRYFKLSYLLTAWTQRAEDEHRLLSTLLTSLLRYEAVPPELLAGQVRQLGLPVPMTVALPPPEDRSFADVWSALGGELKPSIDIVVSAPLAAGPIRPAGPPSEGGLQVGISGVPDADGHGGFADEPVRHHPSDDGEPPTMRRAPAGPSPAATSNGGSGGR